MANRERPRPELGSPEHGAICREFLVHQTENGSGSIAGLLDLVVDLEHRQVHRDDDKPDHRADEHDHDRLEDRVSILSAAATRLGVAHTAPRTRNSGA